MAWKPVIGIVSVIAMVSFVASMVTYATLKEFDARKKARARARTA